MTTIILIYTYHISLFAEFMSFSKRMTPQEFCKWLKITYDLPDEDCYIITGETIYFIHRVCVFSMCVCMRVCVCVWLHWLLQWCFKLVRSVFCHIADGDSKTDGLHIIVDTSMSP